MRSPGLVDDGVTDVLKSTNDIFKAGASDSLLMKKNHGLYVSATNETIKGNLSSVKHLSSDIFSERIF